MADDADNERVTDSNPRIASEADETRDVDELFDEYTRRGVKLTFSPTQSPELITKINGYLLPTPIKLDTTPDSIRRAIDEVIRDLQEGKVGAEETAGGQVEPDTGDNTVSNISNAGSDTPDVGNDEKPELPDQLNDVDIYEMQLLKNEFGPRAIFRNSLDQITHIDNEELKPPISLKQSYSNIREAIQSKLTSGWDGERVSLKKKDELLASGTDTFDDGRLPSELQGSGRKLVLAPSGTGKSTLVKVYGPKFVDMDQIMDWPDNVAVPQWWTDSKLSELVNGELSTRINEWLKRDGSEIGLYADTLGGKLKPNAVVYPDKESLSSNLEQRDRDQGVGLQPGKAEADRILTDAKELLELGVPVYNSFEAMLGPKESSSEDDISVKKTEEKNGQMSKESLDKDGVGSRGSNSPAETSRCQYCRQPRIRQGGGSTCRCA
jgi:hypothetical protein